MAPELDDLLRSLQSRIDAYLPEALALAEGPSRLREAMAYSLLAPGKRLRPVLVMLATSATGGSRDAALPAAAAVEMVHAYSLIHDDLPAMDDDDLRRGLPTCHKQFDEATAILAGDALLTLAFQIIVERLPSATAAGCVRELARGAGAMGMVGGQADDLAWERAANGTVHDLEQIHLRKTGALFRASLRMGALTAHGEQSGRPAAETLEQLDRYGRAFGLAFQITDDLLDVEGDAGQVGKRVGKDAVRGKLTYPSLLGVDETRRRAAAAVAEAVAAAQSFGKAGEPLAMLAGYLNDRDR